MSAYIVTIDSEVIDADGLAGIAGRLGAEVEAHGGKYLVRSGDIEAVSGELPVARITIQEYESMEQVRALFASETFTELRELRGTFVKANVFIVEGA